MPRTLIRRGHARLRRTQSRQPPYPSQRYSRALASSASHSRWLHQHSPDDPNDPHRARARTGFVAYNPDHPRIRLHTRAGFIDIGGEGRRSPDDPDVRDERYGTREAVESLAVCYSRPAPRHLPAGTPTIPTAPTSPTVLIIPTNRGDPNKPDNPCGFLNRSQSHRNRRHNRNRNRHGDCDNHDGERRLPPHLSERLLLSFERQPW